MPYIKEICVAGKTVEIRKYHTVRYHAAETTRCQKEEKTPERIKKANLRKAERELRRILNANFRDGDYWVRLDFSTVKPVDSGEMQKLIAKAIRNMRAAYRAAGQEMKYVYVKEVGPKGGRHVHMVCNKCDIEILRRCWPYGGIHVDPLYSNGQYAKIASYMIKYANKTEKTEGKLIGKRWNPSKNLKKPKVIKKIISANTFRKEPKLSKKQEKHYYIEKDSIQYGISELTGYEYMEYTMIRSG
jgi:hypothetical protein